jgi:hypothetical protein
MTMMRKKFPMRSIGNMNGDVLTVVMKIAQVIAMVFTMDHEDWHDFAAYVPAGAQATFLSRYSDRWAEGIILENQPFSLMDREEKSVYLQDALRYQSFHARDDIIENMPFYMEVERMIYLVDGEWLTFIQVMCRSRLL